MRNTRSSKYLNCCYGFCSRSLWLFKSFGIRSAEKKLCAWNSTVVEDESIQLRDRWFLEWIAFIGIIDPYYQRKWRLMRVPPLHREFKQGRWNGHPPLRIRYILLLFVQIQLIKDYLKLVRSDSIPNDNILGWKVGSISITWAQRRWF